MQFYDVIKYLLDLIPARFDGVRSLFMQALPFALMACALFTAFFALKCGALWCKYTFFFLGGTISAKLLLPAFNIYDFWFWFFFGVSICVGLFCAFYSKYLFRAELVISQFTIVYASLPPFITFFGETFSKIISLIVAASLAFLTVKYKYIFIILTTSFSGSFVFWDVAAKQFDLPHKEIWAVLTGIAALAFQTYMAREQLKETYKDVKKKYKKVKKTVSHTKRENDEIKVGSREGGEQSESAQPSSAEQGEQ